MCKHVPVFNRDKGIDGSWQPYSLEETVWKTPSKLEDRQRERGVLRQPVYCAKCGLLLGLPKKSNASEPYRMAASMLAKQYDLAQSQRRLINRALDSLEDTDRNQTKLRREKIFVNAFEMYTTISKEEIVRTVAWI